MADKKTKESSKEKRKVHESVNQPLSGNLQKSAKVYPKLVLSALALTNMNQQSTKKNQQSQVIKEKTSSKDW
jgi:hypothetical protein